MSNVPCQRFLHLQRVNTCSDSRDENIFVEYMCYLLWLLVLVPKEVNMFDKFMISLNLHIYKHLSLW